MASASSPSRSPPPFGARSLDDSYRAETAETAAELSGRGVLPKLVVVTATADKSSGWYVRSIATVAGKAGIACEEVDLGESADADTIGTTLADLSAQVLVGGVILATPLPRGARLAALAQCIDPAKDVDGANPVSLGRLVAGLPAFAPATAEAVMRLLEHHGVSLAGRHAVVVGRSTVVGKPVAHLLLDRHATVTICHSRTADLAAITWTADVLIVAVGRAGLITAGHIRPGAIVIDVGTNPTEIGGLAGDVDPAAAEVAGALTPVPGGVGPVTTALLLEHTVQAVANRFSVPA
jgi:methylenetetrahydrofolate dehydrogenase (NADP+) / methenyltetrahydrofolate cyclohydrolase